MHSVPPAFACTDCGAKTMHIPQWTHDDAFIECAGCGKPFATIRQLRERLEAALKEKNLPLVDAPSEWSK
ncbi:MAG TPA: hypothetical protein VGO04_13785 [Ensifer sp.]|jgi:predicted nucleic acid-binding Zn ribbon protein|uniref:hypothetical protein n=1 Tax=Ensifer sp. TaxID=1872086 RepID=UPI002E11383A|nr:hypothetical protein [Ensifer sp.]